MKFTQKFSLCESTSEDFFLVVFKHGEKVVKLASFLIYRRSSQATGKASMNVSSFRMQALLFSTDNGTWNKLRIRIRKYLRMGAVGLPGPPGGLLGPTLKVDFRCSTSSLLSTLAAPFISGRRPEAPPSFCWNWCIWSWCKLPPRSTSYLEEKKNPFLKTTQIFSFYNSASDANFVSVVENGQFQISIFCDRKISWK